MRNLFLVLVVLSLATSAFAADVITESNGPATTTICWIKGAGEAANTLVSGAVVVLDTAATEKIGRSVTGSTTVGQDIYGVYEGYTRNITDMTAGMNIPVKIRGYVPIVYVTASSGTFGVTVTAGCGMTTSGTLWKATTGTTSGTVSGHAVAVNAGGTSLTECSIYLK